MTGKVLARDWRPEHDDSFEAGPRQTAFTHQKHCLSKIKSVMGIPMGRDREGNIVGVIVCCNKLHEQGLTLQDVKNVESIAQGLTTRHLYMQAQYDQQREIMAKATLLQVMKSISNVKETSALVEILTKCTEKVTEQSTMIIIIQT